MWLRFAHHVTPLSSSHKGVHLHMHISRLLLDCFDESKHVFQGHVPLDVMSRSKNVPAIATEFQEISGLLTDIIAGAVGQRPLR